MRNDYEIRDGHTVIIINSPKYGVKEVAVSTDKLRRTNDFPNSWRLSWCKVAKSFYVKGNITKSNGRIESVFLHRWILNAPKGTHVDHINHNTLDNTNSNIRVVTVSGNSQNRKGARKGSSSGIRGVSWHKPLNKWVSRVMFNGKQRHVGYFETLEEADNASKRYRMLHMPFSKEGAAE